MASGLFGTDAQVGQISQARIQPAGIPGSTFVQAPRREAGGNLTALASALGTLNSALQSFGAVTKKNEEDPNSRANKEALARIAQMSPDELDGHIKQGTYEGQKVQLDAVELLIAEQANDRWRKEVTEWANTEYDPNTMDLQEELEKRKAAHAAGLRSDISRGHFYRLTHDFNRGVMEKDTENKVQEVKDQMGTAVVSSFRTAIDDGLAAGKSADEVARMVFAKSASNRTFIGFSGEEQNATVLAIAEEYANKGRPDIVKALLEGTRTDAKGKVVPPLASSRKFASTAIKLIKSAETVRDQEWEKNDLDGVRNIEAQVRDGQFTPEAAKQFRGQVADDKLNRWIADSDRNLQTLEIQRSNDDTRAMYRRVAAERKHEVRGRVGTLLSQHGGASRLRDVELPNDSGTGTTAYTVKQQIADEVSFREEGWRNEAAQLRNAGMGEDQIDQVLTAKKLDWYAAARVKNEEWDSLLNGFAAGASSDTVIQGGAVSEHYVKSAELYRRLKASNPAYVRTFLSDDDSKAMLDYYDRLVTSNRMPPEEALRITSAWNDQQPWEKVSKRGLNPKEEADLVEDTMNDMDLDARGSDREYVTLEARKMAERENMTLDAIKAELPKRIADSTISVHGVLVPEHRDLPDDFAPLMEERLTELHPMLAKAGRSVSDDPEDLYVVPIAGQSKWQIVSKQRGPTGTNIIPKDFQTMRDVRARKADEVASKLRSEKEDERVKAFAEYQSDLNAEKAQVERWERRAERNPSRLNKAVAERLRSNFTERVARDLTVNDRAEAAQAKNKKFNAEQTMTARRNVSAIRNFLRSLVPSVKVGGHTLVD